MKIIEGHKLPLYSNYWKEMTELGTYNTLHMFSENWILIIAFGSTDIYAAVLESMDSTSLKKCMDSVVTSFVYVDEFYQSKQYLGLSEIDSHLKRTQIKHSALGALIL